MTHLFDQSKTLLDSDGLWLCLRVKNRPMARKFTLDMKQGRTYDADVKLHREKRSLDANALYWKLCGELSGAIGDSPTVIYRRHIHDIGNYEIYSMKSEAVAAFNAMWSDGHLGRFVQTRKSEITGYTTVLAYYGSSDFNTSQMSRLIDNCVQDCNSVGICTLPPDEIDRLKGEWNAGSVERHRRD